MGNIKRGAGGIDAKMEEWAKQVLDFTEDGIKSTAKLIEDQAKNRAPRLSGALIDSIEAQQRGRFQARVIAGKGLSAPYHLYVEYGTGIHGSPSSAKKIPWTYFSPELGRFVTTYGMRAQPFWTPSILIGQQYFKNYFRG